MRAGDRGNGMYMSLRIEHFHLRSELLLYSGRHLSSVTLLMFHLLGTLAGHIQVEAAKAAYKPAMQSYISILKT